MPIYEYKCTKCDKIYTHVHGIMEDKEYHCDTCNITLDKVFKLAGITFKGGGWGGGR
ncbi:CxxC_CxxC_SSSS, putative regulatory protein, FmdB family [uncultured Caudovirales phage]|uniref:CxxC_CxxC_SSSS, putative regulatory protein, FmdB family n=1 Tax=uncultured Caudovirales phage TaxID=2100421 RepID=A0A6J5L926_9CAUD|nr:CxxC_CxxC_SSSS, putative regulatory protein, FmdB family [uncultured Caudovirales phage]